VLDFDLWLHILMVALPLINAFTSNSVKLPLYWQAEIQPLALIELHSDACGALEAADGVIHSRDYLEAVSSRASSNKRASL
jgi:hypothetical protein